MSVHTQVTAEHVGWVYLDRYVVDSYLTPRGIVTTKPVERVTRYLVCEVMPADELYVKSQPTAGPRVEVKLARFRADGRTTHPTVRSTRWLPTTGNDKTAEIEAL